MPNPKEVKQRIDTTLKAWEENAPTAKLYNLTLAEYKTKVQPSLDARDELERIDVKSIAALTVRDNADEVSHDWTFKIAGAVRSDPNFGEKQPALRGAGLRDEERPRERFDPRLDRTTGPDPQGCRVTSNLHPNTGRIRQRGSAFLFSVTPVAEQRAVASIVLRPTLSGTELAAEKSHRQGSRASITSPRL